MKDKQTPLMRQYNQIKKNYPDAILLFRLGDFFETFNEDAEITSRVCGIVLTKRNNGSAGEIPLAGFPYHQLDNYLPKLVRAGYKVAVCEQLEDPKKARGIVKRGIIEVITPGVAIYDGVLDAKHNNYIAVIYIKKQPHNFHTIGLAFADVSTGEFQVCKANFNNITDILNSLNPSELIINKEQKNEIEQILQKLGKKPKITKLEPWLFDEEFSRQALTHHFNVQNLKGFGIEELSECIISAGICLYYINENQLQTLSHIKKIQLYNPNEYMLLDFATQRNLEITIGFDNKTDGTLISILDKTLTNMGSRLIRKWILQPLLNVEKINQRLEFVRVLSYNPSVLNEIRNLLSGVADLQRICARICTSKAYPKEIVALNNSLKVVPKLKNFLSTIISEKQQNFVNSIPELSELKELIDNSILPEPSNQIGNGLIFKKGVVSELDELLEAKLNGKQWISEYQEQEKAKTGIPNLKISFNQVFGYFIEITHTHKNKIPDYYERKATLTNAERYTTTELKNIEEKILNAEEKISELEKQIYQNFLQKISQYTEELQILSEQIATLDCLQCFAQVAIDYNYTEPVLNNTEIINIIDGRHPVVEKLLPIGEKYQPNSTYLDTQTEQIHIITGPNMSGKSCYLRQVALIVLLAQIGSFVPAQKAEIGIVDRIFTRVGAQDNISSGESTFLVEMQESANIMNNATRKSLILLDEVGRGTATFDGISIAWAIAEYIHNVIGAKTLFATHYHELNELAEKYERIVNYKVDVIKTQDKIIFSHLVKKGSSDHSFGINVAQMSGLPSYIIKRATEILQIFESSADKKNNVDSEQKREKITRKIKKRRDRVSIGQLSIFEFKDDELRSKIAQIDINNLTPLQAFNILTELHSEVTKEQK